jgi:hypothetical protein
MKHNTPRITTQDAMRFVLSCLNECAADGYQTREDESGDVPDDTVPDSWTHDDHNSIELRFGTQIFRVKVTRKSTM